MLTLFGLGGGPAAQGSCISVATTTDRDALDTSVLTLGTRCYVQAAGGSFYKLVVSGGVLSWAADSSGGGGTVTVGAGLTGDGSGGNPLIASAAAMLKAPCRVVATGNITQSGTQTIDGVSVIATDRVLCVGQSTASQNGLWIVAAGAWSRASDAAASSDLARGMMVPVYAGTIYAGSAWLLTTTSPTIGGSLAFLQVGPPSFGSDTIVQLLNASSAFVTALELVNSLTTATAGAEVSRWVVKLLNAGSQVTALTIDPTRVTLGGDIRAGTNGTAGSPTFDIGSERSGLYRPFASTLGFAVAGSGAAYLTASGMFPFSTFCYSLDNASTNHGMQFQGSNTTVFATGNDVQIGLDGALATNAANGFLDIPACAGAATGTPNSVRTGKAALVYDSTNNKIYVNNGGTWRSTAALT